MKDFQMEKGSNSNMVFFLEVEVLTSILILFLKICSKLWNLIEFLKYGCIGNWLQKYFDGNGGMEMLRRN